MDWKSTVLYFHFLGILLFSTKFIAVYTIKGPDKDMVEHRYDELHPSEQADRVVAREITAAILRTSERWITWFS